MEEKKTEEYGTPELLIAFGESKSSLAAGDFDAALEKAQAAFAGMPDYAAYRDHLAFVLKVIADNASENPAADKTGDGHDDDKKEYTLGDSVNDAWKPPDDSDQKGD